MIPPRARLMLAACAAWVLAGAGSLLADAPAAPAPRPSFVYTLRTADKIRVEIFGEDLTQEARVDASGNINLLLVQDVHVATMTLPEAQKTIEDAYRNQRFLKDPHATISVEEYARREVSIQGQVKAPGRYMLPVDTPYTIVDLVTKAGGFTDIAKGSDVTIVHVQPDGREVVVHVDVSAIIKGKAKDRSASDPSLQLQPDDRVFVPERLI